MSLRVLFSDNNALEDRYLSKHLASIGHDVHISHLTVWEWAGIMLATIILGNVIGLKSLIVALCLIAVIAFIRVCIIKKTYYHRTNYNAIKHHRFLSYKERLVPFEQ